jgi:hypothetical protein
MSRFPLQSLGSPCLKFRRYLRTCLSPHLDNLIFTAKLTSNGIPAIQVCLLPRLSGTIHPTTRQRTSAVWRSLHVFQVRHSVCTSSQLNTPSTARKVKALDSEVVCKPHYDAHVDRIASSWCLQQGGVTDHQLVFAKAPPFLPFLPRTTWQTVQASIVTVELGFASLFQRKTPRQLWPVEQSHKAELCSVSVNYWDQTFNWALRAATA